MNNLLILAIALLLTSSFCCTNFLVSKGASQDNTNLVTYAADSHLLYGSLAHYPAATHEDGEKIQIHRWFDGTYLGEIAQAKETYNVIGNMNEFQVVIAETTYGGLSELGHQDGAILDYGNIMYITLQRAKTARDAIKIIEELTAEYGYESSGETFSIADPEELWVMDLIGKGNGKKGIVFVAQRVPDGYVSAHANHPRITTFPKNDPDNCLYASDTISFAKEKGLVPQDLPEDDFSFSDTYCPLTWTHARICENRVWVFFHRITAAGKMEPYLPYIKYEEPTKRMPLFIKPEKKLSLLAVMDLMRDHQENTYFDNTKDIGAQAYHMPYRYRPLFWTHDGKSYLNERPTATQQSGWVFVAQPRGTLFEAPDRKSGIIWFGADEAGSTVFCPMYTCMTKISPYWQEADNDLMTFKFESAFWAFNLLANWAYPRYSLVYPEIKEKIDQYEEGYFKKVKQIDAQAKADPENAVQIYTDFSYEESHKLVDEWVAFWKFLFMKYLDGNRKYKVEGEKNPKVEFPGYPPEWYERIVDETGDHYKII